MFARLIGADEKDKYNQFVQSSEKCHFLQSYEWGELKKKTGWEPIRVIIEEDDVFVGAIQILKRKLPLMGRSIFYAPRGPVIDYDKEDHLLELMKKLRSIARQHNAVFLKIDPDVPVHNVKIVQMIEKVGFKQQNRGKNFEGVQPRYVFRLDINRSEEEILSSFENKTRYNIRLAERKGVQIISDCTKDHLKIFYDILRVTAERDKYLIRAYSYYEDIWETFVEKGSAKLFMAKFQDRYIAGAISFVFGDKTWYIYGASSNEDRNVMPNYLVQWQMILWAKDNGCKVYDFRGISGDFNPENPLYGLYRFKKGFNGELVEFIGEFDFLFSPAYYRIWNIAEPLYKSLRQKLMKTRKRSNKAADQEEL
jgi:lipid II:glycine glycyltransferase (peptidoglycan interpeptide bridge formation enzyme)